MLAAVGPLGTPSSLLRSLLAPLLQVTRYDEIAREEMRSAKIGREADKRYDAAVQPVQGRRCDLCPVSRSSPLQLLAGRRKRRLCDRLISGNAKRKSEEPRDFWTTTSPYL